MPLITLHNKNGAPRVIDTADIQRYFKSNYGPMTRIQTKHEFIDVQEDVATVKRRIEEAKEGEGHA
jgi:hypothetical protein